MNYIISIVIILCQRIAKEICRMQQNILFQHLTHDIFLEHCRSLKLSAHALNKSVKKKMCLFLLISAVKSIYAWWQIGNDGIRIMWKAYGFSDFWQFFWNLRYFLLNLYSIYIIFWDCLEEIFRIFQISIGIPNNA